MHELEDASGTVHSPDFRGSRVVSLVPSVTQTLYALRAQDRLVAVTRFCERPVEARRECRVIGGTKSPHIDEILALEPDLVLANKEENRLEDVERLRERTSVYVFYPRDVDRAVADIKILSRLVDRADVGDALGATIQTERLALTPVPSFRFLYVIWRKPYMVAGRDTFIDALLSEAGGVNVAPTAGRYPEVTAQEMAALRPEVVLLASEPFPFEQTHARELRADLPSVDVRLVDGQLLSWHGATLREALPYLRALKESILSAT